MLEDYDLFKNDGTMLELNYKTKTEDLKSCLINPISRDELNCNVEVLLNIIKEAFDLDDKLESANRTITENLDEFTQLQEEHDELGEQLSGIKDLLGVTTRTSMW